MPGVAVGVVIDSGPSYTYVREEDRRRWEVAPEALFEQAVRNLEAFSRHVRMEGRGGEGNFLGVEEKDGYDAAKVLLPGFRETAAHLLGDLFLAVIPNRDFLFMFRAEDGPVDAQVRRQAEKDYAAQDHPLTPRILRVWKDGRVEEGEVGGAARRPSHLQPHRAHQRQRVGVVHDAVAQPVVEVAAAPSLEVVLEVDVRGARAPRGVGDPVEREVVGGDEADGAAREQAAHDRLGADAPVVRVGAVQDLVEQEQERRRARRRGRRAAAAA